MGDEGDRQRSVTLEDALAAAVGLADLAYSQVKHALRPLQGAIQRSDLRELTRDGHDDLRARGELRMKRHASAPQPHLDALAKAAARRNAGGDA